MSMAGLVYMNEKPATKARTKNVWYAPDGGRFYTNPLGLSAVWDGYYRWQVQGPDGRWYLFALKRNSEIYQFWRNAWLADARRGEGVTTKQAEAWPVIQAAALGELGDHIRGQQAEQAAKDRRAQELANIKAQQKLNRQRAEKLAQQQSGTGQAPAMTAWWPWALGAAAVVAGVAFMRGRN